MLYFLSALVLGIDQLVKALVVRSNADFSIIPNVLEITKVYNSGLAFGLMRQTNDIVLILTLIVVLILAIFVYLNKNIDKLQKIGFMFIISGAISNIIDRLFRYAVVDYIYIPFINFPVFNVADISITVGAGLVILSIIKTKK